MRKMSLLKTEGIVLRNRNLGEADKIITLYSSAKGKISALAKGVKKTKSRLAFLAHPFSYANYLLFQGRTFYTITQGDVISSHRELREDLWRMAYATYFCELVDLGTEEEQPNPGIFQLLLQSFLLLAKGTNLTLTARFFELRFLTFLGYRPQLEDCVFCQQGIGGKNLKFSSAQGGILCPNCWGEDKYGMNISRETLEVMKTLLRWDPAQLKNLRVSPSAEKELEKILKNFLAYYLPLQPRSLQFLSSLQEVAE